MASRIHRRRSKRPHSRGRKRRGVAVSVQAATLQLTSFAPTVVLGSDLLNYEIVVHDVDEGTPPVTGDFEQLIRRTARQYLHSGQPVENLEAFLTNSLKPIQLFSDDGDSRVFKVRVKHDIHMLYVGVKASRFTIGPRKLSDNDTAILYAWAEIEELCRQLLVKHRVRVPLTFRALGSRLKQARLLDQVHADLLDQLRHGRNLIAHGGNRSPDLMISDFYVDNARKLSDYLNAVLAEPLSTEARPSNVIQAFGRS